MAEAGILASLASAASAAAGVGGALYKGAQDKKAMDKIGSQPAPQPKPQAQMPDPDDPKVREERERRMRERAMAGGRESTNLTSGSGGNSYTGTVLGG